ncbi:MAG: NYN domain-containing protein [Candidatus Pacebacteria bacterium]|nr:NYN domain-containing protein [Candidatus Paceibacterota bacterium]
MPIIKHPDQRVAVFIDAQNLYHSAKHLYKRRVNFGSILKDAVDNRKLIRAFAYVVTTEEGTESDFFDALEKLGIETRSKELQIFSGGAKKGDWDVGIAIDAIRLSSKLDTVILVSGDGDFVPLVEYLKNHAGCQVEVMTFGKSASSKLIDSCDEFFDLDKNPKKYLLPGRKT